MRTQEDRPRAVALRRDKEPLHVVPVPVLEPDRTYGRPGGAVSPSSGSTSRPESSRIRGGVAPLACRYQTAPSGRTCAHSTCPSGCSIGDAEPLARSNRWSRCRPSWSCDRSSALASGHQSATETSPSSPGSISVHALRDGFPERRARDPVQLVHDGQAPVARERRPRARRDLPAVVDQLGDHTARPRIDHAEGLVDLVAVLRVLQAHHRPVGRQAAAVVAAAPPGDPQVLGAARDLLRGGAPASSLAYTTNPSRPLIEATSIPGTHAIPSFHPGSTPWSNTRSSPPSNGCTYQRPDSSPVSSCHQQIASPSGAHAPEITPTG